jgi:hypothetical protein
VSGIVQIKTLNADGTEETKEVPFIIGAGGAGQANCVGDCKSAVGGAKPNIEVSTARKRTYWYLEKEE